MPTWAQQLLGAVYPVPLVGEPEAVRALDSFVEEEDVRHNELESLRCGGCEGVKGGESVRGGRGGGGVGREGGHGKGSYAMR